MPSSSTASFLRLLKGCVCVWGVTSPSSRSRKVVVRKRTADLLHDMGDGPCGGRWDGLHHNGCLRSGL